MKCERPFTTAMLVGLFALPANMMSQNPISAEEALAQSAVAQFMRGIKLATLPEGKKMLAETQWITGLADRGENFYTRPEYTEIKSLFSGLFETDMASINGYKELFELDAVTQAGTVRKLKFLVIAYPDTRSRKWKVLQSLDNAGSEQSIDIEHQVVYFKDHLGDASV